MMSNWWARGAMIFVHKEKRKTMKEKINPIKSQDITKIYQIFG